MAAMPTVHARPLLTLLFLAGCSAPPTAAPRPTSSSAPEASVKPGINDSFLDSSLDPQTFVQRFEVESREIFANRARIARQVGLHQGMAVADVGAGTGLFTMMFARDVGEEGKVYAVDISQRLVDHVRDRVAQSGLRQVQPVLCTDRSIELATASVDTVFVCDTYHHFEYPQATLRSIHEALRPDGTLVVVDFERIPGVSREWLLDHVRAGKEVFTAEIEAAGFRKSEEVAIEGLRENYFLRFTKQ